MKKQHKRICKAMIALFGLLIIMNQDVKAQQAFTYSQYMNNQTPLNQAYSLIEDNGSANALLRKQWVGIEGAPTTFLFDANISTGQNGKAGLVVMNDQFSVEHLTEINFFFAHGIKLNERHRLGVSLSAGLKSYIANYSLLDSNDPLFKQDVRQTRPNLGFGVMYYTDKYFFGVSVPELTITNLGVASNQNSVDFKNHYNFSGAYLLTSSEGFKIKPAFLAQYTNGVPMLMSFSTTVYIKNVLGLGADYRSNREVSGLISVMSKSFRLGYCYEFGASAANIGGFSNATHEVSLSYRFGRNLSMPKLL